MQTDAADSVSIVIPVLNGGATICDTLTALQACTRIAGVEAEVIVVDNGSTDNTRELVAGFSAAGVRLLHQRIPGPAAARNRGLKSASGDIIVYLDADTLPTRNWLRELLRPFADPQVIVAGGRILSFRPETPAERYVARSGLFDNRLHLAQTEVPFVASANMAVRRTQALAVGGWSDDMLTAEDTEFCYRLSQKFSKGIVFQESAVLFHRNRKTDRALRRQAWSYGEGAAHFYQRYPEVLQWDAGKSAHLARVLLSNSMRPLLLRFGRKLALVSENELEFARYHRLWTVSFWRGFFSYRRQRRYRYSEKPVS